MPPKIWRVLIMPGDTEIGLELRRSLAWLKEVDLYSASNSSTGHGSFVFARNFCVPSVLEKGWLPALQRVVDDNQITHIFPAHDDVLLALSENASSFRAKIVTSPADTCRVARFKSSTIRRLENRLPTPRIYRTAHEVDAYPVFVKPDRGQGAQRTNIATDRSELEMLLDRDPDLIILEFLPGPEFTVDCFSDRERGLLYTRGRERHRIRNGIAMKSTFTEDSRFQEYAASINEELEFHGAWFFQLKEDARGRLCLLEVAPRVGGTSCLSRVSGVNLPLLSLFENERIPVEIPRTNYHMEVDRALENRYRHDIIYQTVYVDLDDTLVVKDRVNYDLVRLLYQELNKGKKLVLLTRRVGEVHEYLTRFRLQALFDEICKVATGERKSQFITDTSAILIDDSFSECMDVRDRIGIPAFITSMIEGLFDERA
jgi:carbamoyl-phosphate synthase large subunit